MNEYDKQANEFLQLSGTEFSSVFDRFDYYWPEDKQKRNIFKCTLKNDRHTYTFSFGSSLSHSLENVNDINVEDPYPFFCGLKFELPNAFLTIRKSIPVSLFKEVHKSKAWWKIISKAEATKAHSDFIASNSTRHSKPNILSLHEWLGIVETKVFRICTELLLKNWGEGEQAKTIVHPRAYDILASVTKYDPGTFENFCGDFGYDTDSRKADKVYHDVVDEWKNIEKLFTEEQLELLTEIQ